MLKSIEKWLAKLLHAELAHVQKEIAALRHEVRSLTPLKDSLAAFSASVAADAKAIAEFKQSTRMPCSQCGQLTWKYSLDRKTGKIFCSDCTRRAT